MVFVLLIEHSPLILVCHRVIASWSLSSRVFTIFVLVVVLVMMVEVMVIVVVVMLEVIVGHGAAVSASTFSSHATEEGAR